MNIDNRMLVSAIKEKRSRPYFMGWFVYETVGISFINANVEFYSPDYVSNNWQIPSRDKIAAIIARTQLERR